jgi:predicted amidophosphoribosyltransferase
VLAGAVGVAAHGAPDAAPGRPIAVVPVPSARAAFRRRGRRPTHELAHAAVSVLGPRAAVVDVLSQVRAPRDQAGLGRDARLQNLTGTMALRLRTSRSRRLDGTAALVVVDDVVTSGATLSEAARALSPLGLPVVAAVVGARRRGARAGS